MYTIGRGKQKSARSRRRWNGHEIRTISAGPVTTEWEIRSEVDALEQWALAPESARVPEPLISRVWSRSWTVRLVVALLAVLVAGSSFVLWRRAETGARLLENELHETIAAEAGQLPSSGEGQEGPEVQSPVSQVTAQEITFHRDAVSVRVETTGVDAEGASRTTSQRKFYRLTESGWTPVSPSNTNLAERNSMQTESLILHYARVDSEAVASMAVDLDSIYAGLRRDYSLPPRTRRLRIDVEIANAAHGMWNFCFAPRRICVASPVLTPMPAGITEADALRTWTMQALVHHTALEALTAEPLRSPWQDAASALLHFQMRRHNDLLMGWHADLVAWLYRPAHAAEKDPDARTQALAAICERHRIRERAQVLRGTARSYLCLAPQKLAALQLVQQGPPNRLDSLARSEFDVPRTGNDWMDVLAFETVLDYAVATYGPDAVPALVAGFRQYDSWKTLIPAVFAVSVEEFQAGWQTYVRSQR